MEDFRLTKDEMIILKALAKATENHTYLLSFPEEHLNDLSRLENCGLIRIHRFFNQQSQTTRYAAELCPKGKDYMGIPYEKVPPKNSLDWKWLAGIIIAVLGVVAIIIF